MTTPFQNHHEFSERLRTHDTLRAAGFDVDKLSNRSMLPATVVEAGKLQTTVHNGGPLSSYEQGAEKYLDRLKLDPRYADAFDPSASPIAAAAASAALATELDGANIAVKAAFWKGDLFTNGGAIPSGGSRSAIDRVNDDFWKDPQGYCAVKVGWVSRPLG